MGGTDFVTALGRLLVWHAQLSRIAEAWWPLFDETGEGSGRETLTQPITRAHLYSKAENGRLTGGLISMVRLFTLIAVFILLIACINFMNLSTARSEKRAKEVGIRKVVGAQKASIIGQFIGESILLAFIAGVLALGRNLTPFPRPSPKTKLVQRGIYSVLRHPLYTSVVCGAVGCSLLRQSLPGLAVSLVLALFFDAKARREERWLREKFPDYDQYAVKVKRLIPWLY